MVLIGWGAVNARVGELLAEHAVPVDLAGIAVRHEGAARAAVPKGVPLITELTELAPLAPDLVVEAAGRAAIEGWAEAALDCCPRLVCASTSAFCDDGFLARLVELAEDRGGRILITPGAIGALDAIRAASILPVDALRHVIRKPPRAWRGTEAERQVDLGAVHEPTLLFEGSAREAASRYPQNANATATTALAGIGLDRTRVALVADPGVERNIHVVELEGEAGSIRIELRLAPSAHNPKSSELTALSLVRLVANEAATLVI